MNLENIFKEYLREIVKEVVNEQLNDHFKRNDEDQHFRIQLAEPSLEAYKAKLNQEVLEAFNETPIFAKDAYEKTSKQISLTSFYVRVRDWTTKGYLKKVFESDRPKIMRIK